MSFGFRSVTPAAGIPSTTYSGSLPAVIERAPRTRTRTPSPGFWPVVTMSTPATRPWMAPTVLTVGVLFRSAAATDDTEPVMSLRTWVP